MRTARIHRHGDASVISIDDVEPLPPGPDDAVIQVAATSFNPTEAALRSGALRGIVQVKLPYALGWDVAGTVIDTGERVRALAPGDRVVGWLDGGAAAEYAIAPASRLVRAPTAIPLTDAAAIPLAGLTAWQAVFDHARIAEGQRVLVNGAGGGIGGFAVQLAKHAGAHVIATAGPRSAAAVRRQGAEQIVDYTAAPVGEAIGAPVDIVLNLVGIGPRQAADLASTVRPGGVVVSVATPVEPPPGAGVTATHVIARNDAADLAALVGLVDAGVVAVDVAESYRLADLATVHRRSEAGLTRGKITIIP
ncbi:NADP-dependent oxidoreductase [Allonocardiopsis opalescens]|uniref:NADPH:quinone reductase-like Zn-dependent oxidoreductase n=1 Tax=Allonocardiopsis opalescens TaxID=1144618 RepID=A0A2T0Q378_9ACTN|nr:NADP-dependent oxidoreductase [Allonocardiopsis opalescens]PRX98180.1 NADPH:quinone reductase-like Zn-dependent oxidoreductase [Allonocardiopsis opalescens]